MRPLPPLGLLAIAVVVVVGCAPEPSGPPPLLQQGGAQAAPLTVIGATGPVPAAPTLRAVAQEGKPDLLDTHLKALAAVGGIDLVRGNSAHLLIDGPATFASMREAIQNARQVILLESYIFEDEGIAAEMSELLVARAKAGVRVALMRDAVGSISTDSAFFQQLADAGVAVCSFNDLIQRDKHSGHSDTMSITQRDHRKLLVVDERVAFTGGINISGVYGSGSASLRKKDKDDEEPGGKNDPLKHGWRDTQVRLSGPIVQSLARSFAQTWHGQSCPGALDLHALPVATEAGPRVVALVTSDPREPDNRIYQSLMAAITASRRSVQLTMAYFAPGREMAKALEDAAKRGVRVELLLPGRTDFTLIMQAGRSYYDDLLKAGVHLYEIDHAVLHAKTAVVDGVWSSVGSSNMDWRSFADNNELDVVVLGDDFGTEMTAMFEHDRASAHEITPEDWKKRAFSQRFMQTLGRMLQRWL